AAARSGLWRKEARAAWSGGSECSHSAAWRESAASRVGMTKRRSSFARRCGSRRKPSVPTTWRYPRSSIIFPSFTKTQGGFRGAARLYRRALVITESQLGPQHPEMATLYHNLGGLEHARGRFARGEPFARRSVAIREKALGADHPDVAADVAALAAILYLLE